MKKINLIVLLSIFGMVLTGCGKTPEPETPEEPEPVEPVEPTVTEYSVTYKAGEGSGTDVVVEKIAPGTLHFLKTFSDCAFTAPQGKYFAGWDLDGAKKEAGYSFAVDGNKVVTATYEVSTVVRYTVKFVVNGEVVQTSQVRKGNLATYSGATPAKAPDDHAFRYVFRGWDKDITQPITADTTFTAVFGGYKQEIVLDDFESYEDSGSMIDEGWYPMTFGNSGWTKETQAAITLGQYAADGNQCLKFNAWENKMDYKFVKSFKANELSNSANALTFKLMVPSINIFKVILYVNGTVEGKVQNAPFTYDLGNPISGEYVEYVLPLDDPGWLLWNESGKTIKEVAGWLHVHQDDVPYYLDKIEFYLKGDDQDNGSQYFALFDSFKFVTLENPTKVIRELSSKEYKKFTAVTGANTTVELDIANDNTAVMKTLDLETNVNVQGAVTIQNGNFTFTSNDEGATLTYEGSFTNGGQLIKHTSSTGTAKTTFDEVDLNAVQVLDNYEQYTENGLAYYSGNTPESARSGARGAYFAEYYKGSGSTKWGGNNWSIMDGDGDQMNLIQDSAVAHSGNNCFKLKSNQTNAMRYIQWGLYDGSAECTAYRGSKFGIWLKSEGIVSKIKISAYSQPHPTNTTKDIAVRHLELNPTEEISEWTHYEIKLNPRLTYYGFLILLDHNDIATSYLYIDDAEIYTGSPYAQYVAA